MFAFVLSYLTLLFLSLSLLAFSHDKKNKFREISACDGDDNEVDVDADGERRSPSR